MVEIRSLLARERVTFLAPRREVESREPGALQTRPEANRLRALAGAARLPRERRSV
jgi:hypothetical protein